MAWIWVLVWADPAVPPINNSIPKSITVFCFIFFTVLHKNGVAVVCCNRSNDEYVDWFIISHTVTRFINKDGDATSRLYDSKRFEIVALGPQGPPFAVLPRGRGSAAACDAQL